MNILYTLNSGSPGGMERHVEDLIIGMVKNGHRVSVWCLNGAIVSWYEKAGAAVFIHKIGFDIDPIYILNLVKFLIKNHIDVIHSHELKAGTNGLIAGLVAGTKVRISHVHTPLSEWKHPNRLKALLGKFSTICYSFLVNALSSTEIALTQSKKKIKLAEGISENKLVVIPNGLDFTRFAKNAEEKTLYKNEIRERFQIPLDAFVFSTNSRLTIEKGIPSLIEGFNKFLKDLPKEIDPALFYLFISGGGVLEEDLRSKIAHLGLQKSVIITGVYEDDDLKKFYCVSDVFVFPSLAEGFGLVLIEAIYNKLPVICSNLEVLKEVSNQLVTFFNPNDFLDIANKMFILYRQVKSGVDLTTAPFDFITQSYSLDIFTQNYIKLYMQFMEGGK